MDRRSVKQVMFARISAEMNGYGMKGGRYSFTRAEEIIQEKIEKGWSYKGFLPLNIRGTGEIETISLIFEKDE